MLELSLLKKKALLYFWFYFFYNNIIFVKDSKNIVHLSLLLCSVLLVVKFVEFLRKFLK